MSQVKKTVKKTAISSNKSNDFKSNKTEKIDERNDLDNMDNEKEKSSIDIKDVDESSKLENKVGKIFPPKPLPRASRTGSICESIDESNMQKPVARPRTNSCVPTVNLPNPLNSVAEPKTNNGASVVNSSNTVNTAPGRYKVIEDLSFLWLLLLFCSNRIVS